MSVTAVFFVDFHLIKKTLLKSNQNIKVSTNCQNNSSGRVARSQKIKRPYFGHEKYQIGHILLWEKGQIEVKFSLTL
jgi:hypothetical protein